MNHPCLCDICLDARNDELLRHEAAIRREMVEQDKYNSGKFRYVLRELLWAIENNKEVKIEAYVKQAEDALTAAQSIVAESQTGGKEV